MCSCVPLASNAFLPFVREIEECKPAFKHDRTQWIYRHHLRQKSLNRVGAKNCASSAFASGSGSQSAKLLIEDELLNSNQTAEATPRFSRYGFFIPQSPPAESDLVEKIIGDRRLNSLFWQ